LGAPSDDVDSMSFRMRLPARPTVTATALIGGFLLAPLASADRLPGAPHCPIFPPNNPWNQRVDRLPVVRDSATLIRSIGLGAPVHPGFASGTWQGHHIGMPINMASGATSPVSVSFDRSYAPHAAHVPYPLTARTAIEPGTDRHVIVVNRQSCLDYELYDVHRLRDGQWHAATGVVFNLRSNRMMPAGWTSADAAGLPILPALVRYDEVADGSIDHAMRFTAPLTRAGWIYPARHYSQDNYNMALPPMGLRVRLKARVNISHFPRQARIVALALKRYGMILADNGIPWNISGTIDSRWNNNALRTLTELTGRDFEVVDTSSLPHPG
jgi:hypothetical protein